ncbi:MAG: hypothetical protein SOY04_00420 [Clostridium celatum]|nr:hypothetical protein [Clostridium celatum]
MINEIVTGYNSFKIKLANKLGDGAEGLFDELEFLDDSLIKSRIDYIKKISKLIDEEIKEAKGEKLAYLLNKKQESIFEIVILASNNIKNIDFCLQMIDENNDFKICLKALKEYDLGNKIKALTLFDEYFNKNKYMLEHYLISSIYGKLLYESRQYGKAVILLRKAIEKRPEEVELHLILRDIYIKLGDEKSQDIEESIIRLLEE